LVQVGSLLTVLESTYAAATDNAYRVAVRWFVCTVTWSRFSHHQTRHGLLPSCFEKGDCNRQSSSRIEWRLGFSGARPCLFRPAAQRSSTAPSVDRGVDLPSLCSFPAIENHQKDGSGMRTLLLYALLLLIHEMQRNLHYYLFPVSKHRLRESREGREACALCSFLRDTTLEAWVGACADSLSD